MAVRVPRETFADPDGALPRRRRGVQVLGEDGRSDDVGRLLTLREFDREILAAESVEGVAEAALRQVRRLVACTQMCVITFDFDSRHATVVTAYSHGATRGVAGSRWPIEAAGSLPELRSGRILVIDDLRGQRQLPPLVSGALREGIRSYASFPLVTRGELVGLLSIGADAPRAFAPADVRWVQAVTAGLATALHRARRQESVLGHAVDLKRRVVTLERVDRERRELLAQVAMAQEQERQRLAGDLHDDSVQVMTTAALRLQVLRARLADPDAIRMIDQLAGTISLAITRLRKMMFELVPPALDREGLGAVLDTYLERMKAESGVDYRLESRLLRQPSIEARAVLYRIAQEALTNVVKHARAELVQVWLDHGHGGFVVRITDDGVGFLPAANGDGAFGHIGLRTIHQRAEMAGGWCRVDSTPGSGATVECWIPDERAFLSPESWAPPTADD